MSMQALSRRNFLGQVAAGVGAISAGLAAGCSRQQTPERAKAPWRLVNYAGPPTPYEGPNVILIRFGGGVRRLETILHPEKTFCPFVYHELFKKKGMLFSNVEIDSTSDIETSHGQGTLHILTGRYKAYVNLNRFIGDRFEPTVPTLFEYFRKRYTVPEHQSLIINGEDRVDEEFYTASNHHLYGVNYRSTVLSLYRYKMYLLRKELADAGLQAKERREKEQKLADMEKLTPQREGHEEDLLVTCPEMERFWAGWQQYYGKTGLVNPRGDRVLTALALRSLRELRPRLLMVNYQDPDYVHWGNPNFYTRSIAIIDDGIRQIYDAVQADEGDKRTGHTYRDNTVFLVVPDCGRDNNRCMSVPFQHHFNSKSAHQVFVVAAGPGIAHSPTPVDKVRQQISVAATVGQLMQFPTGEVEDGPLEEMLA